MSSTARDDAMPRLPSGIAGLDTILNGGFLKNGVYIVQGTPGAGKTTLGNQIAYSHAAKGGRALYVTLLAETHARMLLHLQSMKFFDPSRIPDAITYISGFQALEEDGLKGLVTLLRREIQAHRASVLVLDGLVAAQERAASDTEFKKFIQALQVQAGFGDCTMFLLTTAKGEVVAPEHTMVDGVIEFRDELFEARSERALEVRKMRGSSYLRGRHSFRISDEGIVVFPRIEALYALPGRRGGPTQPRMSSGIDALDAMLDGGFPAATTTAVFGASGTGKTTLGLHFLSLSSAAEPGLFFGFFETPERLRDQAAKMGLGFDQAVARGDVEIVWQPPTEGIMDELGHRLIEAVRRRGVRRLFVDGLGGFMEPVTQPGRITRFFAALANELRGLGITTIYTLESRDLIGAQVQMPINGVSSMLENLIALRYVEYRARVHRLLSILKVRNSRFDPALREFVITDRGITLADTFESALELLTGTARPATPAPRTRTRRPQGGD